MKSYVSNVKLKECSACKYYVVSPSSKYTLLAVPMKLRLATAGESGYEAIDRTAPTTAVTAHLAAKAMASVPFIIGDFSAKSVPRNVSIALCRETDLSRAFQPGSQYSFVTVAMGVVQVCVCMGSPTETSLALGLCNWKCTLLKV